jgi:hypothetical protein
MSKPKKLEIVATLDGDTIRMTIDLSSRTRRAKLRNTLEQMLELVNR